MCWASRICEGAFKVIYGHLKSVQAGGFLACLQEIGYCLLALVAQFVVMGQGFRAIQATRALPVHALEGFGGLGMQVGAPSPLEAS